MLNLIFKKPKIDSASIPVRWCVDEESLQAIQATGLIPFILLTVEYARGYSTTVHMFPLDQMSAYLDIHYPGKISITGTIVTAEDNKKDAIRKCFISDTFDREHIIPFSKFKTKIRRQYIVNTYESSTTYDFEVPNDVFGKELPNWLKFFINRYWYENKPKDECAQRRRIMLFPFTSLWLVILEFVVYEAIFLSVTLVGWSMLLPVKCTGVLHPYEHTFTDLKHDMNESMNNWLIHTLIDKIARPSHDKYDLIKGSIIVLILPFIPLLNIQCTLVTWHLTSLTILGSEIAVVLGYYACLVAILIGGGIFYGIVTIAFAIGSWIGKKLPFIGKFLWAIFDKLLSWQDRFFTWYDKLWQPHLKAEMLICPEDDGSCLPPITWKDMSWSLRYAEVKNKVCKPMRG